MKINTTRWSPDTCKCVIEYDWDVDLPADQRIHTPSNIVKDCPEHSGLTVGNLYTKILDENQRKNKFYGEIIKLANVGEDVTQEDGTVVRQMKRGISFNFNFDINRVLEVSVIGVNLTPPQKAALQTFADNIFGIGKVRVL